MISPADLEFGSLKWWRVNEVLFLCVNFLVQQYLAILSIVVVIYN